LNSSVKIFPNLVVHPYFLFRHFNMLMDLLHDERQSRVNLENYVNDLRQKLMATKQEIRMNNHEICDSCSFCDNHRVNHVTNHENKEVWLNWILLIKIVPDEGYSRNASCALNSKELVSCKFQ
jgi:hypothetical protein